MAVWYFRGLFVYGVKKSLLPEAVANYNYEDSPFRGNPSDCDLLLRRGGGMRLKGAGLRELMGGQGRGGA